MLDLNTEERTQLSSDGALWCDAKGNESLIGLTFRESIFVLRYQKKFDDRQSSARQHTYLQLRQRHATAHAAVKESNETRLKENAESSLDEALAESFPASDPVAISITRIKQEHP
ncbi:hypothetical protein [Duganella sp. P38]|uniref:hypothetical protein n=1 Tax=Duganella sp. P38 TaxID=3423949 RepID=UPI003D7AD4BD